MYYFIWSWLILEMPVEGDYRRLKSLLIYKVLFPHLLGIFIFKYVFCRLHHKPWLRYIFEFSLFQSSFRDRLGWIKSTKGICG